jgi:hypothetical protein
MESRVVRRIGEARRSRVLFLSQTYFPIMVASVFFSVMQVYGRMTLQRRWRMA